MKQGVSDSWTPTKGCIRSPEGETRSLRLMYSQENQSLKTVTWLSIYLNSIGTIKNYGGSNYFINATVCKE